MGTLTKSTATKVVVAVVAVTGLVVVVRLATRCGPDPEQPAIVEQFVADPLAAAAPSDGLLVSEQVPPDACIEWRGEMVPPDVRLIKEYHVPAAYSLDKLHLLFDKPAVAGGWRIDGQSSRGDYATISYCKVIDGRAVFAVAESTDSEGVLLNMYAGSSGGLCD